jgi:glycosyltransferase involved in cell wall biosynthesis
MNASVVIAAHTERRWQNLLEAVQSIRAQTHPAHEVIVVIDHNPALFARARAEITGARVVENHDTPGLGGARNTGVEHASGDVVAFLDDDAVASPKWLELFAEAYRADDVLGVGGAIEPDWEHGRPRWYPREFDWTLGCSYVGLPTEVHEVRNLIGCNMSFRRDAIDGAGRFRLGYGCDETEFCIRLANLRPGTRLLYVPEASVLHHVPADRGTPRHFFKRCFFEGGSKAVVSRLVGVDDGLESERAYSLTVLPAGVGRGLRDAIVERDVSGLLRAGAIVGGFGATALGYAAAHARLQDAAERRGWAGGALRRRSAGAGA